MGQMGSRASLDPASLQILMSRLHGVAGEMSAVLRRAAFSPNIKERADFSCALFSPAGEMLSQAENIPVHLGSMPASVAAVIERFGDQDLADGDTVIVNDPFSGGTHLNDITLVSPCCDDGRLVGWVANRAHHADVGGAAPGSLPAEATDIYQEGLRVPPLRLSDDVVSLLVANSRTPDERLGDLDAQRGANAVGVERLRGLAGEPFEEVLDYGERRMQFALAALPQGIWKFEDVIESSGPAGDGKPSRVAVSVGIGDGSITFDFEGTDPQGHGNLNAVEAVTVSSVVFALRSVLDPTIPANGGALRPVRVLAPPGTLVSALAPAAVGAGNLEVSQRVADVCLGALAQALPRAVGAASQGTMNNILVGGHAGGRPWVYYETVGGGQGGRPPRPVRVDRGIPGPSSIRSQPASPGQLGPGTPSRSGIHTNMTNTVDEGHRSSVGVPGQSGIHTNMTNTSQVPTGQLGPGTPGQSGIHTCMTNTKNTPIEALERAFPMRVLRQRLRRGSGGAGWSAGGEGIERDLQVLVDATVSLITERRVSQPWGLAGGEPGAVGENWLLPGGDEDRAERLPDKCTIQLKAGDVLRMLTPGGGGWGPPPID